MQSKKWRDMQDKAAPANTSARQAVQREMPWSKILKNHPRKRLSYCVGFLFANQTERMICQPNALIYQPTKTTEETHRDPFHNTVVVLCGCKYFYTVPHWVEHSKRNYIPELNLQISPELFELHILKSGDRLTVPMGVPHFVVSDRPTMSLSFQTWWWIR